MTASAEPPQTLAVATQGVRVAVNATNSNSSLAPVAAHKAASHHAPYITGECAVCHQSNNPVKPGAVSRSHSDLCRSCHDQVREIRKHPVSASSCTSCHNPHNARERMLLR